MLTAIPSPAGSEGVAVLNRVAAWDPDGTEEDILATCHSLAPFAIPHVVTQDLEEAVGFPFVAVAGVPANISPEEAARLLSYVRDGGVLLLWRAPPEFLLQLEVEQTGSATGTALRPIALEPASDDPLLDYVDTPAEWDWALRLPLYATSRCYAPIGTPVTVLGQWANAGDCTDSAGAPVSGRAAVLRASLGKGAAYLFGWRLRHVLGEAERLVVHGQEPSWTNAPVLDADLVRLFSRGIYEGFTGRPVPRTFAPDGRRSALVITHDVDSNNSYERTAEFSTWEVERGFRATYLLTTLPYASGWPDYGRMYTPDSRSFVQQALEMGHDLQSHSFGHFPDFDRAVLGDGSETAADYLPVFDEVALSTKGMSVIGETGVSRWLLENDFLSSVVQVEGFRSGHLLRPADLFEGLERTGYRRDTTAPGGLARGAFPYVGYVRGEQGVRVSRIVEYPLTLSDTGLTEDTVEATVDSWMEVLRINHGNQAPTVLLVHTSSRPGKLEALGELLRRISVEGMDLWIGDWTTFARNWEEDGIACEHWRR